MDQNSVLGAGRVRIAMDAGTGCAKREVKQSDGADRLEYQAGDCAGLQYARLSPVLCRTGGQRASPHSQAVPKSKAVRELLS